MEGEKNRLMVCNAEHDLATNIPAIVSGMTEFANSIYNGIQRPTFTWKIDETNGTIEVDDSGPIKAKSAKLW